MRTLRLPKQENPFNKFYPEGAFPREAKQAIQERRRDSDRQFMDPDTAEDLGQLIVKGKIPERHSWIIDGDEALNPVGSGHIYMRRLVARMRELTGKETRDSGLEAATVEMGYWLTRRYDIDAPTSCKLWVRSDEFYGRTSTVGYDVPGEPAPERIDVTGLGGMFAWFKQGRLIGLDDETNADRWFYAARFHDMNYTHEMMSTPLDSITEVIGPDNVPDGRPDYRGWGGSVIESPSDRSGGYHAWIETPAA